HQRELHYLNGVPFDEEAGGLARGVPDDLDAGGHFRDAGDAGAPQRRGVGDRVHGRLVPVAPDATEVHRVVRRGGVQVGAGGPTALGETARRVAVERRRAERHRDDPLAGPTPSGETSDQRLQIADGVTGREGGGKYPDALPAETRRV